MKLLGVDYGLKRIGLALSDGVLARPLGQVGDIGAVARVAGEHQVDKIVVGLPSRLDSRVRGFGQRLGELTGITVEFWDESFSTKTARQQMIAAGTTPKSRRRQIDQNAAAVILQSYLDSTSGERTPL
jgi:putative Holliday junction resolvase